MLPKKIHFLSAPIDASFKLILFVFNFCVLPWSKQPFPTEPVYAAYRLLQWVQTSTLFSLAEVGSALPLDIGRFPVATAYIQPFELLFLRGWKAFSQAFTDVFQGMRPEQHVTDFENIVFLWSWEISRFHIKNVLMERNFTFLSFLHSADHTSSQFKSK